MRNMLFKLMLARESIVDRGLTRCSSKMQQRISGNLLVDSCRGAGSRGREGGGEETFGREDGGVGDPRRTCRQLPGAGAGVRAGRFGSRESMNSRRRPLARACRPGRSRAKLETGITHAKAQSRKKTREEFCDGFLNSGG